MSIPSNFQSTIQDFINDLDTTFPEYKHLWQKWSNCDESTTNELFQYCLTIYPERFFDILYQNNDIFRNVDSISIDEDIDIVNTQFFPNVEFKTLFNCEGLSDNTKNTMWKYLQLVLFIVVGSSKDKNVFGDTANIFDGIDENELSEKLKETMEDMGSFFQNMGIDMDNLESNFPTSSSSEPNEHSENTESSDNHSNSESKFPDFSNIPNLENFQQHLKGMFDGKIGTLAKELADEISGDFQNILGDFGENIDEKNPPSAQDIIKKIMKNPKKMMNLIKTIGDKIKNKMDSGDISKDELMGEASELLSKMKEMGGEGQMKDILKKFAGGMGKNARMDMSALHRMAKSEGMRDRMRKKMEAKKNYTLEKNENNESVFKLTNEEIQEKSIIQKKKDDDLIAMFNDESQEQTKKNKKKKKKKN